MDWNFDKKIFREYIKKGNILLNNDEISSQEKHAILQDLKVFAGFIMDDYEIRFENSNSDIDSGKSLIIDKMKYHSNLINTDTINNIKKLSESITEIECYNNSTLDVNEQRNLTLENYKSSSEYLYNYAKELLSKDSSYIQPVKHLYSSSYCYEPTIIDKPYIVIDVNENPWILNHETEHWIEITLKLNTNGLYKELGAIFFELLFTDKLYDKKGYLNDGDCFERITDFKYQLNKIYNYYCLIKYCENEKYNISTMDLINKIIEIFHIPKKYAINYLFEQFIRGTLETDMMYCFSYLKALELRNISKTYNNDKYDILSPYLNDSNFNFNIDKNNINILTDYINEMKNKILKKQ